MSATRASTSCAYGRIDLAGFAMSADPPVLARRRAGGRRGPRRTGLAVWRRRTRSTRREPAARPEQVGAAHERVTGRDDPVERRGCHHEVEGPRSELGGLERPTQHGECSRGEPVRRPVGERFRQLDGGDVRSRVQQRDGRLAGPGPDFKHAAPRTERARRLEQLEHARRVRRPTLLVDGDVVAQQRPAGAVRVVAVGHLDPSGLVRRGPGHPCELRVMSPLLRAAYRPAACTPPLCRPRPVDRPRGSG